jgi:hypothetical protein
MSVSVAAHRPTVTRRLQIVVGVLVALVLIAAVVVIALSDSKSSQGRTVVPTGAHGQAAAIVARPTFRDPVTHAVIPLTTLTTSDPSPIRDTPGPGHK